MGNADLYDTFVPAQVPQPWKPLTTDDLRVTARAILPPRFQRVRARGWKMPAGGKCCSRPGRWGNPFVGSDAAAYFAKWADCYVRGFMWPTITLVLEHCLIHGKNVALHQPTRWRLGTTAAQFFADVQELAGRPLGCFCALDEPCRERQAARGGEGALATINGALRISALWTPAPDEDKNEASALLYMQSGFIEATEQLSAAMKGGE